MIKSDAVAQSIAKVPLWLFPFILFSIIGLTSVFVLVASKFEHYAAGAVLAWFLAPRRSPMVGYTLMACLVAGAIWLWAARGGFTDRIVPFARPYARYWFWAIAAFVVSWAVMCPAFLRVVNSLGLHGRSYNICDPATFALVTVWAVLLGPACEEILFRGFGVGYLIARGVDRWAAGGIAMILFVLMHWPYFGPGGMLLVLPFSVLVTVLRITSGNLTPGLLFHMMNNIGAFLVGPMLWARGGA